MKVIRNKNENLEEMLEEMKVGGESIFDTVSNYEITKVPGGFIWKNEYCGMVFVPDVPKPPVKAAEKVEPIKNSVAKTEPKKTVTK